MPRPGICLAGASIALAAAAILSISLTPSAGAQTASTPSSVLHETRELPSDLELGGELAGLPPKTTRYVTRQDLLAMPQVSYTVTDDPNFKGLGPTRISGVSLEELAKRFGAANADMVVAICDDKYRANYPRDYRTAHRPLLVLKINGKGPAEWPQSEGSDMGPYLISHPKFTPRFKVLSHEEEMQIPWGVVRIDFRNEKQVFGAIEPRGPHANDAQVQDGYRIARENCFRCHDAGDKGGRKAGVTWTVISTIAAGAPDFFMAYVRNPKSNSPRAQMPANPEYDAATLRTIAAYFKTFAANSPDATGTTQQ
ncbi:MAG: c-type cytochrome [Candidatus Acidiferrales bacterium]